MVLKTEGDGCTPEGIYSLGPLYYRSDRIKLKTYFNAIPIKGYVLVGLPRK